MLLAVDIGNTNVVLGLYPDPDGSAVDSDFRDSSLGETAENGLDEYGALDNDGELDKHSALDKAAATGPLIADWRMRTEPRMTADELALTVRGLLGNYASAITGVSALSTVPSLLRELRVMLGRYWVDVPRVVVEPGVKTGVPLLVDNPKEVGADRVINALAAHRLHEKNCIVVDFGTSTNIDVISAKGEFLGGAFAPGIEISLDALAQRAAQLRKVELVRPRSAIGKNTVECLQSGILYGFVGQVDGLVRRIQAELAVTHPGPTTVLATGGLAPLVVAESDTITHHVPDLTLLGLRLVYERNR